MHIICKTCEILVTVYLFHLKEITLFTSKEQISSLDPMNRAADEMNVFNTNGFK